MSTDVVPRIDNAPVVTPWPTALAPARPAAGGSTAGATGQLPARPLARQVPASQAAFSVLDLIGLEMANLNTDLATLGEQLIPLSKTADALDALVSNLDEVSNLYQAPTATLVATDAASAVASHTADLVVAVHEHSVLVQALNAAAFQALATMRDVQDAERATGAGPALLRDAGRR